MNEKGIKLSVVARNVFVKSACVKPIVPNVKSAAGMSGVKLVPIV